MSWHRSALIFIILFIYTANIHADQILLKNGTTIEGKIVKQSRTIIQIRTLKGIQKLQKSSIKRIQFSNFDFKKENRERKKREADRIKKAKLRKKLEKEKEEKLKQEETKKLADEQKKRESQKKPEGDKTKQAVESDFVWRSAVLPGWGQYSKGANLRGAGFLSSVSAFALYGFLNNKSYQAWSSIYRANNDQLSLIFLSLGQPSAQSNPLILYYLSENSKLQRKLEQSDRREKAAMLSFGAMYIWNIYDAWLNDAVDDDVSSLNHSSLIWRSAVLPGWGQIRDGNRLKGTLFMSSFILGSITLFQSQEENRIWQNQYNTTFIEDLYSLSTTTAQNPVRDISLIYSLQRSRVARDHLNKTATRKNVALVSLAFIYFGNLLDVYYFKNSSTNTNSPSVSIRAGLNQGTIGIGIRF